MITTIGKFTKCDILEPGIRAICDKYKMEKRNWKEIYFRRCDRATRRKERNSKKVLYGPLAPIASLLFQCISNMEYSYFERKWRKQGFPCQIRREQRLFGKMYRSSLSCLSVRKWQSVCMRTCISIIRAFGL